MLPSELYAKLHSTDNVGFFPCHWCGSPASPAYPHTDPPPVMGVRNHYLAKHPSQSYQCRGCYLFRLQRITVHFLDKGLKDIQTPPQWSWWMDDEKARVISPSDLAALWHKVLYPPLRFVLALLDGKNTTNHIQLMHCNDFVEIRKDTPLTYTINNKPFTYTIYELEEGVRHGPVGKEPGVQTLMEYLGPCSVTLPPSPQAISQKGTVGGKPVQPVGPGKTTQKVVVKSGGG